MSLIPDHAFHNLPKSPEEKILKLIEIAEFYYNKGRVGLSRDLLPKQLDFANELGALARELGFGNFPILPPKHSEIQFSTFMAELSGFRAVLRLRSATDGSNSNMLVGSDVSIGKASSLKIKLALDQIRVLVENSELPNSKKDSLIRKIDDLLAEVDRKKLSFVQVLTAMAAIASVCGGSTTALAYAPKAQETILNVLRWFDEEHEAAQEEQRLLSAPLKALPAPSNTSDASQKHN